MTPAETYKINILCNTQVSKTEKVKITHMSASLHRLICLLNKKTSILYLYETKRLARSKQICFILSWDNENKLLHPDIINDKPAWTN